MNELNIFKTSDNKIEIQVEFVNQNIWLNQKQIALIFDTKRPAITKHLINIFNTNELQEDSVCSILEHTAEDGKKYKTKFYNLDAIISIGYRVNSKRATEFRIWATNILKNYLVEGVAINQKRLEELNKIIQIIDNSNINNTTLNDETKGLLNVLENYTKSFVLLNQFDSNSIPISHLNENITYEIKYEEAKLAIKKLKNGLILKDEATDLFGNEKDDTFKSSLENIVQTFDGKYLYPSIEEQSANLLYFVIKNHSFSDGNKRIGAFLFVWFLEKNRHQFNSKGQLKINDNGLVALSLLIAQSNPSDKDLIIKLIINMINESN